MRPSELREAEWCEFDFAKKVWTVPEERKGRKKGREHVVPLSLQAIEALNELRSITVAYAVPRNALSQTHFPPMPAAKPNAPPLDSASQPPPENSPPR